MSSLSGDPLASKTESEFALLKKNRARRVFKGLLLAICVGAAGLLTFASLFLGNNYQIQVDTARRELLSKNAGWASELSSSQLESRYWLLRHGTAGEVALFDMISSHIFASANSFARRNDSSESSLGSISRAYISFHKGFLRSSFIVIASWRLWLVVMAFAFYRGWRSWRVHSAPDILGETGNNRLFYSGIRAGLENLTPSGAPNKHVRGLACPLQLPDTEARNSDIGKLLVEYGAANSTNLSLAGVVLAYPTWPAHVAQPEEEGLLEPQIADLRLPYNTLCTLRRVLELHAMYREEWSADQIESHFDKRGLKFEPEFSTAGKRFAFELQKACHRVLTPNMRRHIATVPPEQIATVVLAFEAGKYMAYGFEGGRWQRKSIFPELTARSVLHSTEGYGSDYDFDARLNIRRALVYGSRYSALGPVTVPVDLSEQTRALRQWVELLMSCPYDLERVANEVEMHGILIEVHAKWLQLIFDNVMTAQPAFMSGSYSTPGNLFLVPISSVVRLARRAITLPMLRRLEQLIVSVTQDQKLRIATGSSDDALDRNHIPAHARVFKPFSDEEVEQLCRRFGLKPEEARDWSSLRIVLNSFGWLGRRVGDYSVPESSIIYAILKVNPGTQGANHLNLLGIPGMVPLRATRLEERWGKSWQDLFTMVQGATMAEAPEDYERLLRGISDSVDDDGGASSTANVG
ncbi:MAG: hypothetical protein J5J00_16390 [Deltaproteobacteria bacterium]|nr:hypothetical protein [Deltaproteobacteria bacterium]